MPAKKGLTVTTDITVRAREIDFVTRFAKNWDALREIMGIMRPIKKTPGTVLTSYTASLDLEDGYVGEGEEIPYSEAKVQPVSYADIQLEKFAKAVSIEAVTKYGAENAIQRTDEAFLNELQGMVMDRFYDFLPKGQLYSDESSFQMAISMAIGLVKDKFKKLHRDASRIVVWVNTLDAYAYLGSASITLQSQLGLDYIKNFLGADTLILSSEIPRGIVFATPVDNIVNYYVDPSDVDYAKLGLNYTVQGDTNILGFHANGNYSTAVGESYAVMGLVLWAEYMDAIAVVSINGQTYVTLNKKKVKITHPSTGAATVQLVATVVPSTETVTWTSSDTTVATVDSTGLVTTVGAGTATITASVGSGSTASSATCDVTVEAGA